MPLGYDRETVYKAELAHDSIYFVFTDRRKSLLSIMRADVCDDDWTHYGVSNATAAIRHPVTSGAWIVRFPPGGTTAPIEIVFSKKSEKGCVFKPHIHETNMTVPSYDIAKRDDMADAFGYAVTASKDVKKEVKQATEWYKRTQGMDFANPLQPKIKFTSMKEVKDKMYLQLISVTIFNRKTLEVDFHKNVIAENNDEAYLLAVQSFGKYDPKIHVKAAKCILGFTEFGDKNCEEDE